MTLPLSPYLFTLILLSSSLTQHIYLHHSLYLFTHPYYSFHSDISTLNTIINLFSSPSPLNSLYSLSPLSSLHSTPLQFSLHFHYLQSLSCSQLTYAHSPQLPFIRPHFYLNTLPTPFSDHISYVLIAIAEFLKEFSLEISPDFHSLRILSTRSLEKSPPLSLVTALGLETNIVVVNGFRSLQDTQLI